MGNDNTNPQGNPNPAPAQNPPAQNPPAQNPPAQNPPAQNPPAQNPPAQNPSAQNPPAQNPPAQNPPAQNPPAQNPPAQNPPAQNPEQSPLGDTDTPGMPGDQTQQGLKAPEGTPQNIVDWAVSQGFNQAQFDAAIQQYNTVISAQAEATKTELQQAGKAKLAEWGDAAERNLSMAKSALKTYDKTGELSKLLSESGYGNHPVVLQFFKDLSDTLKEGEFTPGRPMSRARKQSAAEKLYPSMKQK